MPTPLWHTKTSPLEPIVITGFILAKVAALASNLERRPPLTRYLSVGKVAYKRTLFLRLSVSDTISSELFPSSRNLTALSTRSRIPTVAEIESIICILS